MKKKSLNSSIFCKSTIENFICKRKFSNLNATISFRSFDLEKDLLIIHEWVNMNYSKNFWQMRGSIGLLRACYQCIQQSPFGHSFVGLLNNSLICQFDLYKVEADELASFVEFENDDCGFHLIMSPNNSPVHGLTATLIQAFLDFYFSRGDAGKMFAEPDTRNLKSIDLLERTGFKKIKTVDLSYKTAHVYSITKEQFYATNKIA